MADKTFTNQQIAKVTGMAPRAVLFYNELVPAIEGTGQGRGNPRRYDRQGLFRFLIIRQLAEYGITIGKMAQVLDLAHWHQIGAFIEGAVDFNTYEATAQRNPDMALAAGSPPPLPNGEPDDRHVHLVIYRHLSGHMSGTTVFFEVGGSGRGGNSEYSVEVDLTSCTSFLTVALDVLYRQAIAA